jgi:hypothetical protein
VNEATLTQRLKEETTLRLPPPVVFTKHNDGSTSGIPDASVCAQGETWWAEVKFVRRQSTLMRECLKRPLQLDSAVLREMATSHRTVYVAFYEVGQTEIWAPFMLKHHFEAGVASPRPNPVAAGLEPYSALRACGSCFADGLDYGLLARVIRGD